MNSQAQPTENHRRNARSEDEKQDRRDRVLSHGMSSLVRSIADAIVIKNDQLFFLAQPDGNIFLSKGRMGWGFTIVTADIYAVMRSNLPISN